MRRITQEEIEQKAKNIPNMDDDERRLFNEDVLLWFLDVKGINLQDCIVTSENPEEDRCDDVETNENPEDEDLCDDDIETNKKTEDKSRYNNYKQYQFKSVEVWEMIIDTTDSFDPNNKYAYCQQLNNLVKLRRGHLEEYNHDGPGLDGWGIPSHNTTVRRVWRAYNKYCEAVSERNPADAPSEIPTWFLEEYIKTIPKNSRKSLNCYIEILKNTPWANKRISTITDNDGEPVDFISEFVSSGEIPIMDLVHYSIMLTDSFIHIVQKGGIKKKQVFEKINANVAFSCSSEFGEIFSIEHYMDYVDHEYVYFFNDNNYDPTDTTIIFHHWFYSDEYTELTNELKKKKEWEGKKSRFSKKYRKPYNKYRKEWGVSYS